MAWGLLVMNKTKRTPQRITVLNYKKGEQIFKQNDYGISIYKILEGRVEVFREDAGVEISLAALGKGDIFGETAFLPKGADVRYASARAMEDSQLEIWHPRDLLKDYEKVSPVLKFIANQSMNRLLRMNMFMERLVTEKEKIKEKMAERREPTQTKRRHYRKKVTLPCVYVPAQRKGPHLTLAGHVKDISAGGLCLEADPKNDSLLAHQVDDMFHLSFVLPNEKELKVLGKIVYVTKKRDSMRLGMVFPEISDQTAETRKILGFFLLRP